MSKLLKPGFVAQIHSAQRWVPYSHVLRVFHTMGLAAHTMGLVAHTIGLTAVLEDGLVLAFLVMHSVFEAGDHSPLQHQHSPKLERERESCSSLT
jgi:hypothetical protein